MFDISDVKYNKFLLYTFDASDEEENVNLGGIRIM